MTINRNSKAYKQIVQALEQVFLILAGMYFIYRISKSTTFSLRWPHWYESFMLGAMSVVAVARVLATGLLRKESLIAGTFVLVYGMVYRTDGYSFLLFLMLLTVGFMDIDYASNRASGARGACAIPPTSPRWACLFCWRYG